MAGTILLVEDEPSVGELVRGYLTRDGYRVVWVRSGEDALVELDRHPVRMVLLDIGLPGRDGFDVCREIRSRSTVPILMLTARDEEPDRVVWVRSGEEALAELERHPVRLVLLDIGLPGKDGFDVCRQMRARSQVPILMLTARDELAGRERLRDVVVGA